MAEITYQPETRFSVQRSSIDWGAIWAGLFTFVAIWSVFGCLGYAIFASATTPGQAAHGASFGMGIWAVVLTLIAMYVAGLETGKLAELDGRTEAIVHGIVMFGLSLVAITVLTMSGRLVIGGLLPGAGQSIFGANLPSFFGYSGWFAFFALFLGWLGAMAGAASGVKPRMALPSNVRDMRPAA